MQTNKRSRNLLRTHEGAMAHPANASQQLRRSVMSCLLWEKEFYEDGASIADRIDARARDVSMQELANLAVEARTQGNLRHVPLLLLLVLIERGRGHKLVSDTIYKTIQRADELTELLALYFKDGKRPLAKQLKLGLARAFTKFNEYQLAKYNRKKAVKLVDVLRLVRPKPQDEEQAKLWGRLRQDTLAIPETWETQLSSGRDPKETWEQLLSEGKLGYLALLRNLRNMVKAGVDSGLVNQAILDRKGAHRILPFRFVAAARAAPQFEPSLDKALVSHIEAMPLLKGDTFVLVDVSGSMDDPLSEKSDLKRIDAAAALGAVVNAGYLRVFTFSNNIVEVPARRGMAGVDAIIQSQPHRGTNLADAVARVNHLRHARLIVITDEQAGSDYYGRSVPDPVCKHAYMINVASCENGVGYGKWTHIDGFSESVLTWIHEFEQNED